MPASTSVTKTIATGIWQTALDIVYPVHCVLCGEFGTQYLCEKCALRIPEPLADPICARCGHHAGASPCHECLSDPPAFVKCVCAGEYSGNLMEAIHWLKYRDRPMLAEPLGRILSVHALKSAAKLNKLDFDCIVPIPMHTTRQRVRGYNHAERLADVVGKHLNLPVRSDILKRIRRTKAQVGLAGDARRANLRGAFRVLGNINDQTILLIDDVSTTSSTMRECAKVLKDAGAKVIYGLTLAAG
jgi:ComF family protein